LRTLIHMHCTKSLDQLTPTHYWGHLFTGPAVLTPSNNDLENKRGLFSNNINMKRIKYQLIKSKTKFDS
jgi:hypothetical protein